MFKETFMHDFRKLEVWKKSIELVKEIYFLTNTFPKDENYGLKSQIKRSAISIPSNIAEGCGRDSPKQFQYHLNVALGSICELETQIILSNQLHFSNEENCKNIIRSINEVSKMVNGLKRSINKKY